MGMIGLLAAIAVGHGSSPRRWGRSRGRVASGAGHAHQPLRRFGRRSLAAARPARPHRPMDLPEARLAHGRRDRGRRAGGARAWSSCCGGAGRAIGTWLVTRDRGVKLAMLGAVGAVLLLMVGTRREGLRLHDARQRLLPWLPHLRPQRPGLRPSRHRDLPAGQQARGEARHAQLPQLPPVRAQGPDQGAVLLDHRAAGPDSAPRQGPASDLRRVPRPGRGEEDLGTDRVHRRAPDAPGVRLLGPQGRGLPDLPRAHAPIDSSRRTPPAPRRAAT